MQQHTSTNRQKPYIKQPHQAKGKINLLWGIVIKEFSYNFFHGSLDITICNCNENLMFSLHKVRMSHFKFSVTNATKKVYFDRW